MKAWLRDILDALLLRSTALARVAARPDAFLRGLLVILAVALLAGLPTAVSGVIAGFGPPAVIEPSELQGDLTESLTTIQPWLRSSGVPEAMLDQILGQIEDKVLLAGSIISQVQRADTIFPRPLAQGFTALGGWFSQPFANSPWPLATPTLATWLGYGVWVMLAAKLLGGRGTLHGFFGATAFFAAPYVLTIFSRVPVLGGILGVVACVWGLVIYIAATAASHRLSLGRAVLAVFLPVIALLAVVAVLFSFMTLLALLSGSSR
jgi:hypothetical protein